MQFCVKDLAEHVLPYGIPGVIVDGTDPCQVYDATREACERAYRGEGPTLIEAKMMRMKGHAIHDAAQYVPAKLFEYWRERDPIARFEKVSGEREEVGDGGGKRKVDCGASSRRVRGGPRCRSGVPDARSCNRQDASRRVLRSIVPRHQAEVRAGGSEAARRRGAESG